MANYKREVSYNTLNNDSNEFLTFDKETIPPVQLVTNSQDSDGEGTSSSGAYDVEHEDASGVIIHVVPEINKGGWTHIEDLDSFFKCMYQYYLKGGFFPMLVSDCLQLLQYSFIVIFLTFMVFCVKYPVLFKEDTNNPSVKSGNVTLADVIYPTAQCVDRVTWKWLFLVILCTVVWFVRLVRTIYLLYHAYDTKMFYNNALKIKDSDLGWISWNSVLARVREAQREQQMCIHKQQITELDIYHRILRFNNYFVAMVNKRLLSLHVLVPLLGEVPYLSKGLKYNLELLLFSGPWSPWENCWQLKECYKDSSKRIILARQLRKDITKLALLNFLLSPLIQAWQILYYFFSYAELIKRSPATLGLRTWSLFARISLRHFNELDHELSDRLNRAHKPATKYLASFPSPISTVIAKNVAFLSGSVLGVLIVLSVYNESVLTVEHMLTIITALGCILAAARGSISEEGIIGQRSSEELLVQVLGHVHYLPASWRGKAHTKNVATHFQQIFQFKFMYVLMEILSPIMCPYVLYSLRHRALDIVDFYRNFTVSVLGIGDVCSFAQMDVRKHGNPDWPAAGGESHVPERVSQFNQGEDGKTELSLIAFSCRNPNWRVPHSSQRHFLNTLRMGVNNAANNYLSQAPILHQNIMQKTMLGSYFHQSVFYGLGNASCFPLGLSVYHHHDHHHGGEGHLPSMEESINGEQVEDVASSIAHGPTLTPADPMATAIEEQDMSLSTLHLYDVHIAKAGNRSLIATDHRGHTEMAGFGSLQPMTSQIGQTSTEDTPLLRKPRP